MSGRLQEQRWLAEWRRQDKPPWRHMFTAASRTSKKVRCRTCGRRGYSGLASDLPMPWQIGCLIGHAYVCTDCGAPTHNLESHRRCRSQHEDCLGHCDTQYRALIRILEQA